LRPNANCRAGTRFDLQMVESDVVLGIEGL
jgi:hypothetical protein